MPQVPTTPGEVQRRRVRQREMAQPNQIMVPMTEDQMKAAAAARFTPTIQAAVPQQPYRTNVTITASTFLNKVAGNRQHWGNDLHAASAV